MGSRLRSHLRHNLVAYVALFFALGATSAYAANTVFSSDIVDGEVKNPDIAPNAVGTGKLADGGVRTADVLDKTWVPPTSVSTPSRATSSIPAPSSARRSRPSTG
jgi:hypothetical protein